MRGTRSELVVEFVILHFIVSYGLFVVFNLCSTCVSKQMPTGLGTGIRIETVYYC